jgi:transposase
MPATAQTAISVIGIDIGKNSFHIVGLDDRGATVLRQKWSRSQVEARLANVPRCLIGMEACVGAVAINLRSRFQNQDVEWCCEERSLTRRAGQDLE